MKRKYFYAITVTGTVVKFTTNTERLYFCRVNSGHVLSVKQKRIKGGIEYDH